MTGVTPVFYSPIPRLHQCKRVCRIRRCPYHFSEPADFFSNSCSLESDHVAFSFERVPRDIH
jgi:hypothetical protein